MVKEKHYRQSVELLQRADSIYSSCSLPLLSPSRRKVFLFLSDSLRASGVRPEVLHDVASQNLRELASSSSITGQFESEKECHEYTARVVGSLLWCEAVSALRSSHSATALMIPDTVFTSEEKDLLACCQKLRRLSMDSLFFTFSPSLIAPPSHFQDEKLSDIQDNPLSPLSQLLEFRLKLLKGEVLSSAFDPIDCPQAMASAMEKLANNVFGVSLTFSFSLWSLQLKALSAVLELKKFLEEEEKRTGEGRGAEEKRREKKESDRKMHSLMDDGEKSVKEYLRVFEGIVWSSNAQRNLEYCICLHTAGALMHYQVLSTLTQCPFL